MSALDIERLLLDKACQQIEQFTGDNWEQRKLRAFLLTLLDYLRRVVCRPDHAHDLPRWWAVVDEYWQVLESDELAGPHRRTVLAQLLGDEDEGEVEDHEVDYEDLWS